MSLAAASFDTVFHVTSARGVQAAQRVSPAERIHRHRQRSRRWRRWGADPPHRPHLLHGDFTPDNVMVGDGTPVPIDLQDLAITLVPLRRFRDADELRHRYRAGYGTVRPWRDLGDDRLDPLVTAPLA